MFDRKKRVLEAISMIKPTSKSELKQSCLMLSNLDVEKAEKMYDFLVKDMPGIPEIPIAQKSFIENVGEQANGVFSWLRENEDVLTKSAEFIRGILQKKPAATPTPLPPINQ